MEAVRSEGKDERVEEISTPRCTIRTRKRGEGKAVLYGSYAGKMTRNEGRAIFNASSVRLGWKRKWGLGWELKGKGRVG